MTGTLPRLLVFAICLLTATTAQAQYRLWPDGVVPVRFGPSVTEAQQDRLFALCAEWSVLAGVSCRPAGSAESAWLLMDTLPSGGPYDSFFGTPFLAVGTTVQRGQTVWRLSPAYWASDYAVLHDLGHVFGLIDTHQRSDRDQYIEILDGNIDPYARNLFVTRHDVPLLGPYDFHSVMHFTPDRWSDGGPTMRPRPAYQGVSFGSPRPTAADGAKLQKLYGPPAGGHTLPPGPLPVALPVAPALSPAIVSGPIVTLRWSSVSGAARYLVLARNTSGALLAALPAVSPGLTVQAPSGVYFVTVAAESHMGRGAESAPIQVIVR